MTESSQDARLIESMDQFAFTPPFLEDEGVESDTQLTLRTCIACKQQQPLSNFYNRPNTQGGVLSKCKECHKEAVKQYKATHPRKVQSENPADLDLDQAPSEPMEVDQAEPPCMYGDSMYVLVNPRQSGEVKIGRAMRPTHRAHDLSTSQPFRLEVKHIYPGFGFLEASVHKRLQHKRITTGRGREWFALEPWQADILIQATIVEFQLSV
jgi:T5orf172 domain